MILGPVLVSIGPVPIIDLASILLVVALLVVGIVGTIRQAPTFEEWMIDHRERCEPCRIDHEKGSVR